MRSILYILLATLLQIVVAQENPGVYMSDLASNYDKITKDTWDYIRQASRGKNANKIEKRRMDLAQTLKTAKYQAGQAKAYQGDITLKVAYVNYLNFTYLIINDNFKQIVDLERIAEESYDDMEAYLRTKEEVNDKMDSVSDVLSQAQTLFASKYNINLTESDSRISKKLNAYGRLNNYYNNIYLVFFQSNFYEAKMMVALAEGNVGDMEQYRQALEVTSKEGMEALKQIRGFNGSEELKKSCYGMLEFYYGEAVRYMPGQIEFFSKKDRMDTMAKNFQSKKKPTEQEVNEYNKAIKDFNDGINSFNEANTYLNKHRSERFEAFNKAIDNFYDSNL